MTRTKRLLVRALASAALWTGVSAQAALIIDFESAPGGGAPTDDGAINGVYTDGTTQVQFWLGAIGTVRPLFESVGRPAGDANIGFVNPETPQNDSPNSPGAMGSFFARTLGFGQTPLFIIEYLTPVNAASGEIWDIDARRLGGAEQWTIRAYSDTSLTNLIATQISASGNPNSPTGETDDFNGMPYLFGFSALGSPISAITIQYSGTAGNVGLAFDNFNADSDITQVPVPGSFPLLIGGLALLVPQMYRRKNR